ncbi:hypothetical protein [Flavobacterium sp.]|uniref:hypothetical protein n=1 Tax=Flavobacterium sp. TaxID=239 RepID=UPI00286E9913|nr:hypothetical protein [Flavobacterium sp.]
MFIEGFVNIIQDFIKNHLLQEELPWELVLSYKTESSIKAYKLEAFIKRMKSRSFIERIILDLTILDHIYKNKI